MHTFLVVELTNYAERQSLDEFANSTILNIVFDCYMKLLCNDLLLDVNFIARRTLLLLLKVPSGSTRSRTVSQQVAPAVPSSASRTTPLVAESGKAQSAMSISELSNEPGLFVRREAYCGIFFLDIKVRNWGKETFFWKYLFHNVIQRKHYQVNNLYLKYKVLQLIQKKKSYYRKLCTEFSVKKCRVFCNMIFFLN